jgi:hypothetical protein
MLASSAATLPEGQQWYGFVVRIAPSVVVLACDERQRVDAFEAAQPPLSG